MDHVVESKLIGKSPSTPELLPHVPAATTKPRLWTAFLTCIAAVVAGQVLGRTIYDAIYFLAGVINGFMGGDPSAIQSTVQDFLSQPLVELILSVMPVQIGVISVVLLTAWLSKTPFSERLGFVPQSGRKYGVLKLSTMAAFTLSAAVVIAIMTFMIHEPPSTPNQAMSHAIVQGSWLTITLVGVLVSIVPALVEETMMRGHFQRRLLERWSPVAAVGMSTAVFAVLHFDSLAHVLAVVPTGLVTGMLAYRTNSTKPGMIVHGLHNATIVVVIALRSHGGGDMAGLVALGLLMLMAIFGAIAVFALFRRPKPQTAIAVPPVATREPSPASFGIDSRLAGQMG